MSITSGIVLFAVCWFMTLFMVLPLFVRSQDEAGDVAPGTPAGAPDDAMMKKKLVWTTVAATVVFLILFAIIESGVITIEMIESVTGAPD